MKRFLWCFLLVALLAGCSLSEDVTPPPGLPDAPSGSSPTASSPAPQGEVQLRFPTESIDLSRGKTLYAENCSACHGESGKGDGPQAGELPRPVPALGDPDVANLTRPMDWYAIVTIGKMDQFMPPFRSLDDSQRWDVVAYALSLASSTANVEMGSELYRQECAVCHGNQGQGTAAAPGIAVPGFMVQRSGFEWYATISRGMSGGMPAFEDSLDEGQIWALIAHLRDLAFHSEVTLADDTAAIQEEETQAVQELPLIGEVRGWVINGTQGASLPKDLQVTLRGFDGQSEVLTQTSVVDEDGWYAFEKLEGQSGRLFVTTVEYAGTVYGSEMAHLSDDGPTEMPITIFESTPSSDGLQVERLHIIFDIPASGILQVIELWVCSNSSDRTILAEDGQGGLQIELPPDARNLQFESGALGERFLATEDGFLDTAAIRPGEGTHQIVFSYDLDFDGDMDFSQSTLYPVKAIVLLAPPGGATLSGQGVLDMGPAQMGEMAMNTYRVDALDAGDTLDLTISYTEEMLGSVEESTGSSTMGVAIGLGALGVVLVGVGAVWYWRGRLAMTATPADDLEPVEHAQPDILDDLDASQEDLLQQLAALDDAFAAGDVEGEEYQARRDALKQHLLNSMQ